MSIAQKKGKKEREKKEKKLKKCVLCEGKRKEPRVDSG